MNGLVADWLDRAWVWVRKYWKWILIIPVLLVALSWVGKLLIAVLGFGEGSVDTSEDEQRLREANDKTSKEADEKIENIREEASREKDGIEAGEPKPSDIFNREIER